MTTENHVRVGTHVDPFFWEVEVFCWCELRPHEDTRHIVPRSHHAQAALQHAPCSPATCPMQPCNMPHAALQHAPWSTSIIQSSQTKNLHDHIPARCQGALSVVEGASGRRKEVHLWLAIPRIEEDFSGRRHGQQVECGGIRCLPSDFDTKKGEWCDTLFFEILFVAKLTNQCKL
jgi:hypothetical protein